MPGNFGQFGVPNVARSLPAVQGFYDGDNHIHAQRNYTISGVCKDASDVAKSGATVYLFNMTSGVPVLEQTTLSDGSGNYSFTVDPSITRYWLVDYKSGAPDQTGATINTLSGV